MVDTIFRAATISSRIIAKGNGEKKMKLDALATNIFLNSQKLFIHLIYRLEYN